MSLIVGGPFETKCDESKNTVVCIKQGRREDLKLERGAHDTSRALFPLEKGVFSKNKRGTSLFTAKSWKHVPPVPPGSYVYCMKC